MAVVELLVELVMRVHYIDQGDGTLKKCYSPQEGVPFLNDWLLALLARRAAFEAPSLKRKINGKTGLPERDIIPYAGYQEQAIEVLEDGRVRIVCLGCAGHVEPMLVGYESPLHSIKIKRGVVKGQGGQNRYAMQHALHQVRIGGVVQVAIDEPYSDTHQGKAVSSVRKWRRRPVSKMGLGCPSCVDRYQQEVSRVGIENDSRRVLYQCMRQMYINAGTLEKIALLREPKDHLPFIDILDSQSVAAMQYSPAVERKL